MEYSYYLLVRLRSLLLKLNLWCSLDEQIRISCFGIRALFDVVMLLFIHLLFIISKDYGVSVFW